MTEEEICKAKVKALNEFTARGAVLGRERINNLKNKSENKPNVVRTFPIPQIQIRDSYDDLYPDDMTESDFFGGDLGDK